MIYWSGREEGQHTSSGVAEAQSLDSKATVAHQPKHTVESINNELQYVLQSDKFVRPFSIIQGSLSEFP